MTTRDVYMTATEARYEDYKVRAAVFWLLDRLKPFARAWAVREDAVMPEHTIKWSVEFDDSPDKKIGEALEFYPALWLHTLPNEVCVIRKSSLVRLGASSEMLEYLELEGRAFVETVANKRRMENEMGN